MSHCYSQESGVEFSCTLSSTNNYRAKNAHVPYSLMAVLQINYGNGQHKKPVFFCCTQTAMSSGTC